MMANSLLLGGQYPARVAASFADADNAHRAAERLLREPGLSEAEVRVVDPQDPLVDHGLLSEKRSVVRTLVRSHMLLGLLGGLLGLATSVALQGGGFAYAAMQPVMVTVTLGVFGAIVGLLAAGLVSARPGQGRLGLFARDAARRGNWMVIALAADEGQREQARSVLKRRADEIMGVP